MKAEKHSGKGGGRSGRAIAIKTYLHGPVDYAKKLKLGFRVGDLELPEEGRKIYTSSREEDDLATNMCSCDTTI